MSSSSEDSDYIVVLPPKRKRKRRRFEDSPPSTSSESPIISSYSFRKMKAPRPSTLNDSESSGSPLLTTHRRKIPKLPSDSDSETDSDMARSKSENDGQSAKCPICLESFKTQEIGTLDACDHTFCLDCIQEWSKNRNTCPMDRQEYRVILVMDGLNGRVTRRIPVGRPTSQDNILDISSDVGSIDISWDVSSIDISSDVGMMDISSDLDVIDHSSDSGSINENVMLMGWMLGFLP